MAWDPFTDFERQFSEMERQLADLRQRLLGGMGGQAMLPPMAGQGGGQGMGLTERGMRMPTVDVTEEGGTFVVTADLPGVNKEDINLNVNGDQLTIQAEVKRERREGEREQGYIRQERAFTRYQRAITLPQEVDAEQVRARYKNGVLEVRLPKKESREQGRRVQIE